MPVSKEITSVANPIVKQWVQLLSKKGRDTQGRYLIEGIHLLKEALHSKAQIEQIVIEQDKPVPPELLVYDCSDAEWIRASRHVIEKCTSTQAPQEIFAILRKPTEDAARLMDAPNGLVVVLDQVQDPGNLGTIIRSAEAAGATGIVLGEGTADLYNPKVVRATMGSMFRMPIIHASLPQLLPAARNKGIHIISTGLDAKQNCFKYNWTTNTWFILGNEGAGVSPDLLTYVNEQITIPMKGSAESLNVAMAATVLLYEAMRQRCYME